MLNNLSILGRVTKPLELRYLQNGTAVLNFDIANSLKVKDSEPVVTYLRCVCYGRGAEVINQFVGKGDRVLLQGELRQNSYKDSTGATKTYHYLQVNNFDFIEFKNKKQTQNPEATQQAQGKQGESIMGYVKDAMKPKTQKTIDFEISDDDIPF
jgi:single-strand DNA-binding protein